MVNAQDTVKYGFYRLQRQGGIDNGSERTGQVTPVRPEYPGPKQAGPDGERLRLKNKYFFDEALKYCLNCKRCDVACPSGVKISDIIQEARIEFSTHGPKLRDRMLASTDFMGTLASS